MNHQIVDLYHRMPPSVRSVIASGFGYYLRWARYGMQPGRAVNEILRQEAWSPDEIRRYQALRLAHILDRAATRVPYYQALWKARRRLGDASSWMELENWTVLEKDTVRARQQELVADDCNLRALHHSTTSGSTGTPVHLWVSRKNLRTWYALHEARTRAWYGVSRRDRWAILGGQLIIPPESRTPPFWVWNAALHQLYLSVYHISAETIPLYLDALVRYRVRYLLGYTTALYQIANYVLTSGSACIPMQVVVTNAEPLSLHQRRVISSVFQCPVRETYGMSELAVMASECEHGTLHLWPTVGIVEVIRDGRHVPPGETGDLICTGLLNDDMPLIRYRTGDRGALAPPGQTCPCGRTLPILARVEGRHDDLIHTTDGRALTGLDAVFADGVPVREGQLIQEDLQTIRLRFVPAEGYSPQHGEAMVDYLKRRIGEVNIVLEVMDRIPRGPNGKFRAQVSRVHPPAGSVAHVP